VSTLMQVAGVSKRFAGIAALDDVSLDVNDGELVGLIGPNGAGKTTLFNCVSGLTRPDNGSLSFAGRDIADLPPYRRARLGLARTFQRMELFTGMTVREHLVVTDRARRRDGALWKDLVFGSKVRSDESDRVAELLRFLDLERDADRLVDTLSLGRGRIVELARALMTEPKLLLLDEPSSGLDVDETEVVIDRLRRINRERKIAVLLVEHDIAMVRALADRVYVLDFGTLIASGTVDDVFGDVAVQRAYLGRTP
jgi:branched-chain amino acid transport system ATP-binding protein